MASSMKLGTLITHLISPFAEYADRSLTRHAWQNTKLARFWLI